MQFESQPARDLLLQSFEQSDIRVRVQAAHPAPVAGKAQQRRRGVAGFGLGLTQQHADIHELALHHVRHVAHQEELARYPFPHASLPAPPASRRSTT
jgi:hypothetical protein